MLHASNVKVGIQMHAPKIKSQVSLYFGPRPSLEVQLSFLE
jgi:hypothetical protein